MNVSTSSYRRVAAVQEPPHNPFAYQLADPLPDQLDLFSDPTRWPKKPYCTDSLEAGIRPRTLAHALRRPYVQANPPHLRVWSIFDVDRPGGGLAWEDGRGLPPPTWTSVNRQNSHAHLVWGLSAPVLTVSQDARRAPIRYLVAVEAAFRAQLRADPGYGGLITKNPAHPMWRTWRGPRQAYELGELADWVDLPKFLPKQGVKSDEIGLGRNCTLFDWLRLWAYKAIRQHRKAGSLTAWQASVYSRALDRNADFQYPLDFKEVEHIARSVAKWVWARDGQAEAKFVARQAFKGRRSGIARLQASEDKRASARLMASQGVTQAGIAAALDVSTRTIRTWLNQGESGNEA